MLTYKQLYQANDFEIPSIPSIKLCPFPPHDLPLMPDQLRDFSIKEVFQPPNPHFTNQISAYSQKFEHLCAKENLYPMALKAGPNRICIISKECLMVGQWGSNVLGKVFEGGDELVVVEKWQRVRIAEIPTAVVVGRYGLYVGHQSGKVSQYIFRTKSWQGSNEELQFPIMQLSIQHEQQNKETSLVVLDSAGNIVHLSFSHKTFLDKIIKTLSSSKWISLTFRDKKRQKIKRMFKNFLNKDKEQQATQPNSSEQIDNHYHYNRFSITKIGKDVLLAVVRKGCLQLLLLDQQYQLIKNIVADDTHKDEVEDGCPWVQLGEGGFEHANAKHHVLVMSIGKIMAFYRIVAVEDSYQVVKVSQIELEEPLIHGEFVSNNLLLVQDKHNAYLATVGDKPHQLLPIDTSKFSYVDFFVDEQNLEVDRKLLFSNIITPLGPNLNGDQKFLALEGKRLVIGKIYGFESILEKLVYDKVWEQGMCCFRQIYNSQYKLCCNINENLTERNKEMQPLCKKITEGYLQKHMLALKEQPEKIESCCTVNNLIYFLLSCDNAQLLFLEAERVLSPNQLDGLFINELSRYVEQSNGYSIKVPFVSQKYLTILIQKYKGEHKDHILENLFMQFDLTQMEKLLLLGLCLREDLYRSLISICAEQKDFITPIVRLCGIAINQPEKRQRIAEIIYWYLGECLQGRMTQFGNDPDYISMLATLINFIFIPSSLEMLMAANHHFLIQIVYAFFDPKIMRYILENEDRFFMRKDSTEDLLFEGSCLSQFRLYEKMLSSLVMVVQASKRQDYESELNRLLITLMLRNQFPFLARFKIRIIQYFIKHPLLFVGGEQLSEDNEVEVNGQLMRLLDSLIRSISQKCLSLREKAKQDPSTIVEIEGMMAAQKARELEGLLEQVKDSQLSVHFAQTKCYIHHQLGHYSQVLQLYLRITNKRVRTKAFLYLSHNLNEFQELTLAFLNNLLSFLRIDQHKTVQLLYKVRRQWVEPEQIIDKIVQYPDIQLGYIQKVIQGRGEKSKKLLLRHLEIVLQEHGDEIENFIGKVDYPLQEAFRMCEERNNRMGKACILIKSGRNMEGVIIISEMFLESVRQYLPVLRKADEVDPDKKKKIHAQLKAVLDTCHKQYLVDNERGEDIWQKNTELIFKKLAVNNIDTPHVPQIIRSFLNQMISQILAGMLQEVSTDFFLNRFVKTFGNLPFRLFLEAYNYIYNRLSFTFTLEKLNKDILQEQQYQTWNKIMRSIYRAHICNLQCHSCNHYLTTNQRMLTFSCSHVMHQQCYYEHNVKKNRNELCPLCYTPMESNLMVGNNRPLRYRVEFDQRELLKGKLNKMKYFDRTSQLATMDNLNRIEEWVEM